MLVVYAICKMPRIKYHSLSCVALSNHRNFRIAADIGGNMVRGAALALNHELIKGQERSNYGRVR